MSTVRALIDAAPNYTLSHTIAMSTIVLAVVVLVATSLPTGSDESKPRSTSVSKPSALRLVVGIVAFFVLVIGAIVFWVLMNLHINDTSDATRSDLIATYLLAEHDLITLSPVHIEGNNTATATAVDAEGVLWAVDIAWLADVQAQLPDTVLPEGFNPIDVTISPTTLSADAQR